jgi:hypothetical protein
VWKGGSNCVFWLSSKTGKFFDGNGKHFVETVSKNSLKENSTLEFFLPESSAMQKSLSNSSLLEKFLAEKPYARKNYNRILLTRYF